MVSAMEWTQLVPLWLYLLSWRLRIGSACRDVRADVLSPLALGPGGSCQLLLLVLSIL